VIGEVAEEIDDVTKPQISNNNNKSFTSTLQDRETPTGSPFG